MAFISDDFALGQSYRDPKLGRGCLWHLSVSFLLRFSSFLQREFQNLTCPFLPFFFPFSHKFSITSKIIRYRDATTCLFKVSFYVCFGSVLEGSIEARLRFFDSLCLLNILRRMQINRHNRAKPGCHRSVVQPNDCLTLTFQRGGVSR